MSGQIEYVVKKDFKYNGVDFKKGDIWEPQGGKWDEQIINTEYVEAVDSRIETRNERMSKKAMTGKIVALKDEDGLTFREIADRVGVHYSTASRIYKREKDRVSGNAKSTSSGSSEDRGIPSSDSEELNGSD